MPSHTHAILSELHRLLSTYSVDDFREARRYAGLSSPMRDVLLGLFEEASSAQSPERKRVPSYRYSISTKPNAQRSFADEFLVGLRNSTFYNSIRSMNTLARFAGIRILTKPKESKERFAQRLAKIFSQLPADQQDRLLNEIRKETKTQTEGWIDVIRNTSS